MTREFEGPPDEIFMLSPDEVAQLERVLDAEPTVIPQLARLFAGHPRQADVKDAEGVRH